jgi:rfaE bifunctional protein nucleotidyltransferase chain/domain
MHKLQWIQHKIYSADTLSQECNVWRAMQKKIVFTNGCFDILHRGHLDLLARAADLGNILILGLNTDNSIRRIKEQGRPVTSEQDRAFQAASLLCVDAVCLFDEDTPEALIKMIKPDVLVKGGDYNMDQIIGADFVKSIGGSVEIIPFIEGYSTTSIINRIRSL